MMMLTRGSTRPEGHLVLHRDVLEEVRHGLLVVDAPHGLRQHDTDVHRLNLMALHLLNVMWDCVGNDNLIKRKKRHN